MAIAYGNTMLDAEMNVCHMDPNVGNNGSTSVPNPSRALPVDIHEHMSQRKYAPPKGYFGPNQLVTPVTGFYQNGQFACHWRRATVPQDDFHRRIYPTIPFDMLWAFQPRPDFNYNGDPFTYHEQDWRGRLVATLSTGDMRSVPVSSFSEKQAHGFGMATVWLVLFPFSIFWARYLRSKSRWILLHITIQTLGTLGIITFLTIITTNSVHLDRPHPRLGLSIISLLAVQVTMGLLNAFGLWFERFDRMRKWFQRVHYALGASLIIMAAVQVGLGLDTLYPWVQPRYPGLKDPGFASGKEVVQANVKFAFDEKFKTDRDTVDDSVDMGTLGSGSERTGSEGTLVGSTHGLLTHALRSFSWDSLNQAILDGELLVVANRKFVYDISQWIRSHPGGQIILLGVAGTDISDDYFHEAGFDAEQVTFVPPAPPQRLDRRDATTLRRASGASLSTSDDRSSIRRPPSSFGELSAETAMPSLTEEDWKRMLRARRTHVHTKLAIQRLAQLLVGELRPPPFSAPVNFDPNEFRRYAITEKKLLTPLTTRTPVYSLRFCLLYPHATPGPFPSILPGQCVEIQIRIDGEWISRYYTPVRGADMGCFEVDVKATVPGRMSRWLVKQKCGDRQVKIRGPFGASIVGPGREVSGMGPPGEGGWRTKGVPEEIVFVAAGSGISPFLQMVRALALPIGQPLRVINDFVPNLADEMPLTPGDVVVTEHHYNDGWALGHTARGTARHGMFPLSCTLPPFNASRHSSPPPFKLTLINCVRTLDDIFEPDLLLGVEYAYPGLLTTHHFVESLPSMWSSERRIPGFIHSGRLTRDALAGVLGDKWGGEDNGEEGFPKVVYVCGPSSFNGFVVDVATECGA
ncbi:hypothetical protein HK104_005333, partial [Borealophlyctis nickersoniae]